MPSPTYRFLSQRVRPDVEVAPWVYDEIRKLETLLMETIRSHKALKQYWFEDASPQDTEYEDEFMDYLAGKPARRGIQLKREP